MGRLLVGVRYYDNSRVSEYFPITKDHAFSYILFVIEIRAWKLALQWNPIGMGTKGTCQGVRIIQESI